ncbi:MAG: hypothetical protein LBT09_05870 [Planctomycetaceae bacterium]|nr:hypothetical protein [Planctomycetaceae bacterium]
MRPYVNRILKYEEYKNQVDVCLDNCAIETYQLIHLPIGDPFYLNLIATGFLFEHASTGATVRRMDRLPYAAAP